MTMLPVAPGRVGAAAQPAERGVEGARAGVQRRQHIGEAEPAGVVEMAADRQRRDIGHDPAKDALDRRRLAVADRVGEHDRVGPGLGDLDRDAAHPLLVDGTLDRAAKGGGEPQVRRGRLPSGAVWHNATTRRKSSTDSAVAAADIGAVVALADRQHEIHLVHAERQAAFGALEVRDQRRHRQPRQSQRMAHDRLGVGELRQQLWRDKRADLDLAHPGGMLGVEPGDLLLGRHDFGEALQPVAHADFADKGGFAHSLLPMMLRKS